MDAVLLDELQSLLGVLSDARCGVEGNAALLRCVNANLASVHRKLQARYQQEAASRAQQPSAGLQGAQTASTAQQPGRQATSSNSRAASASRMPSQGPTQQQQQQQQPAQAPRRAPLQLPAEFVQLQQLYASLAGPAGPAGAYHGPSVTSTAAAGFLHSLESVYGQQSPQHQQQQGQTNSAQCQEGALSVQAFADQAHFVGLMAAVLSAVQALTSGTANSSQASSLSTAQLKQAVPVLLQQCSQWLQEHSSANSTEQQPGAAAAPAQQQQQQQHAEAVRWRNRALRSITATAAAGVEPSVLAAGSASASASAGDTPPVAAPTLPGIWLPQNCWAPPCSSAGTKANQAGSSTQASGSDQAGWQLLLPQSASQAPQQLQQPQVSGHLPADGSSKAAQTTGSDSATAAAPVLTYSNVAEVVQHSRQLQKIQQLSLQLAVESEAAPSLLNILLQCCQQLQQQATTGAAGDGSVTHDRCCALYRLLCALTAGPVKERGLGVGCQLAVEAEVPDDRLPGW